MHFVLIDYYFCLVDLFVINPLTSHPHALCRYVCQSTTMKEKITVPYREPDQMRMSFHTATSRAPKTSHNHSLALRMTN